MSPLLRLPPQGLSAGRQAMPVTMVSVPVALAKPSDPDRSGKLSGPVMIAERTEVLAGFAPILECHGLSAGAQLMKALVAETEWHGAPASRP